MSDENTNAAPEVDVLETMDLTDLLDLELDDLEDLPEFKPFKAGAHRTKVTFEQKEINDKVAVELSLVLVETLELSDPQEEMDQPGHTCSTAFYLDNEFARGALKKCAIPLGVALGLSTIRDIVDNVKDVECIVLTKVRKDKNDPDKLYLDIKELQVVA